MLHTSAETMERFRGEFDKFGDCYSKTLNPKDLQLLLQVPLLPPPPFPLHRSLRLLLPQFRGGGGAGFWRGVES